MKKLKKLLATMSAVTMCAVSITPFVSNAIVSPELDWLKDKITDYTTAFTLEDGRKFVFNNELTSVFMNTEHFQGANFRLFTPENADILYAIFVPSYDGEYHWFDIDAYMLSDEDTLILKKYITENNIPYYIPEDSKRTIYLNLEPQEEIKALTDIKENLGFLPLAGFPMDLSEIVIASVENTLPEKTLDGDANEDGTVDIADATAIIQHIGNKDKYALTIQGEVNADCYNTGDGITGMDAVAIQQLKTGMIQSLDEV